MRLHPEVAEQTGPAIAYPYGQYVAVGQPMAPVAPAGGAMPGAAGMAQTAPNLAPAGWFLGAIAAAFLGGAGMVSIFAYQQPTAQMARTAQRQADIYQERYQQHEQRLTEVRNQVCTAVY